MQGIESTTRADSDLTSRYQLGDSIGRGGVGEVFRAQDTQLHRWVAIKRLRRDLIEAADGSAARFVQEARHLAALQHPNIVTVYDCVEDRGGVIIVMELLSGRTLQDVAEKAPLLERDFAAVMIHSLEGLIAAHALGMLHRDLKPSNLMIVDLPSGAFQTKILDFGLAKVSAEPSLQTQDQAGTLMGSVYTMSPEQLEGAPLDERSDLYSLGCSAYFALTTYYPFQGQTVVEVISSHLQHRVTPLQNLRPDLSGRLCAWVMRLMALRPEDRPASAAEALAELQAALSPATTSPKRPVAAPPKFRLDAAKAPKRPPYTGLAVALAVVVAAGAFLVWFLHKPGTGPEATVPSPTAPASPSSPADAAPASVLNPNDKTALLAQLGREVVVEGRLEREGVNKSGTIRFLNFAGTQRGDLTLVFFVKDAPADFTEARLTGYVGRSVRVRGTVSAYEGTPQIVIRSFDQIEIL